MIIGIDMYPQLIFKTGVRIVIDNLVSTLKQQYPEHAFVELRPKYNPFSTSRHSYGRKAFNHLQRIFWTQVELPLQARRNNCDLLFCTCHFSPFLQPIPTVTLFYDLAIWRHPEWYPKPWVWLNRIFAEWPSHFNAHITTIAEDGRKDIIELFHLPPNRVTSIYLGLDLPNVPMENDQQVLQSYGVSPEDQYILYMGPAIKHKNLTRLVDAFGQLIQRLPEQNLLLVIGGPSSNLHGKDNLIEIRTSIERNQIQHRVRFTDFVPREHCSILYRNATVYAFPSLFEGFGLPMIEAMSCGVPVVAANKTSLPEIGGDAAIYFDPLNTESIADSLYAILTRPELQQRLSILGRERAKHFTWKNTAEAYVRLFEKVLNSK